MLQSEREKSAIRAAVKHPEDDTFNDVGLASPLAGKAEAVVAVIAGEPKLRTILQEPER